MHYRSILATLCFVLLASCSGGHRAEPARPPQVDTLPMMAMQIQKCSRLYTSEYRLHKIVTYDDSMSFRGSFLHRPFKVNLPVGKRRVAIPMTASVKAYIDFNDFDASSIRRRADRIEIVLPDPQLVMTSTQIDHEAIRKKVSLLRSNFSDEEMTRLQQQGRDDMVRSLARLDIIENARQSATRQLVPIVEQMGYKPENITVTFRKKFTLSDIPSLIRHID